MGSLEESQIIELAQRIAVALEKQAEQTERIAKMLADGRAYIAIDEIGDDAAKAIRWAVQK